MIWRYTQISREHAIPFPTAIDQDRVFITGGYGGGSVMIQVKQKGDQYDFIEQFRYEQEGSVIHPTIYYKDHFFANFNTDENLQQRQPRGLVCFDPAGNVKWWTGNALGMDRGGFIIADDLIIALDGRSGELILAEANPETFIGLSRARVFEGSRDNEMWAPLALSDGYLVVRDEYNLKCFYLKADGPGNPGGSAKDREDRPTRRYQQRGNY